MSDSIKVGDVILTDEEWAEKLFETALENALPLMFQYETPFEAVVEAVLPTVVDEYGLDHDEAIETLISGANKLEEGLGDLCAEATTKVAV